MYLKILVESYPCLREPSGRADAVTSATNETGSCNTRAVDPCRRSLLSFGSICFQSCLDTSKAAEEKPGFFESVETWNRKQIYVNTRAPTVASFCVDFAVVP